LIRLYFTGSSWVEKLPEISLACGEVITVVNLMHFSSVACLKIVLSKCLGYSIVALAVIGKHKISCYIYISCCRRDCTAKTSFRLKTRIGQSYNTNDSEEAKSNAIKSEIATISVCVIREWNSHQVVTRWYDKYWNGIGLQKKRKDLELFEKKRFFIVYRDQTFIECLKPKNHTV